MMNDYLGQSERLVGLVLLVDARRGPEREESTWPLSLPAVG